MKKILASISLAASGLSACSDGANTAALSQSVVITASMDDFRMLEGKGWDGSLSYLNYGSDERSTIPVKLEITILDDQTMQYAIQYPGEEQYNAKESLKISNDGTLIDGYIITARALEPDGTLVLTAQGRGRDDGRTADIQMVYFISENAFRIRKNVRFHQDETFFNRNEYNFSR